MDKNNKVVSEKTLILDVFLFFIEVTKMELAEVRNELEKMAKKLTDFRGSL